MTAHRYLALPTAEVEALRAGKPDANGQRPERRRAAGPGNPCRHCLRDIEEGETMLVLAYRPFPVPQPYAESGPIFLHAEACPRHAESTRPPALFLAREKLLVRGYGSNDRIVYGSGQVVPTGELAATCDRLLGDPEIAYLHLRSAANNCYQCRVERAS